jgi:predicted extracellular nuclease
MKGRSKMKIRKLATVFLLGILLTLLFGFQLVLAAGPGDITVNEIMQNPDAVFDSDGEWFEVYNPTGSAVDINGWTIKDNDFDSHVIANGGPLLVPAGDYIVLGRNADFNTNGGVTVAYQYTGFFLGNSADEVILLDASLVEIDRVEYDGGATFPDPTGASMSLLDPSLDNNVGANWCESDTPFGDGDHGTPGSANSCTPTAPVPLTIMQIQGDGRYSPFQGYDAETSGVLTLITANGRDAWIQDPNGDGDPATSDGIFIDDFNTLSPQPQIGDLITVKGQVEELQFGNSLPLTRIDDTVLVEINSSGNPLPAPIELSDLPDEVMQEGELFWEPLEGMLVSVRNAPVVAATSRFGEFGMLTKTDAKPGSGFFPRQQQILVGELSQDPNVLDYNPERIAVDDATLDDPIVVRPGDRVRSLVGVVDYTFSMYKLQPSSYDVKTHNLPNLPASNRSGPNGNTVITTFNVENLFDLVLNTPTPIDVFGQVGFDPGSSWGPPSTQNNTLRRKPVICQGDTDGSDPFDPAVEWDGFGQDNIDDLGSHTETCGTATELFISEYVEGSSNNKAIEIYNGTSFDVNLATSGYGVDIYFNGNTTPGTTIQLAGTLAAGDVFVLADDGAAQAILDVADQTSTANFFNGDDTVILRQGGKDDAGSTPTPEELETQLTKLAMAIDVELRLPEIIVTQEGENTAILQELGDRVNAATGTDYVATSFETSDGRGIEAGFLWDANRVGLLDAYQMSGPDVEQWFGPTSPSPGREPIVGVFNVEGQEVTIIGNHFKSKGGDDPLYGVNWPAFRVTEIQRKGQARVVRDFASGILDADPGALVMVTGDLNDFQFGEPGENAIGDEPGHPLSILEGGAGEVPLTNLLELEKPPEVYTFVFDSNSQVLDHMLVSPALLNYVVAADILHFNAGYPSDLGADPDTTLRASDHDPLEGRFTLE